MAGAGGQKRANKETKENWVQGRRKNRERLRKFRGRENLQKEWSVVALDAREPSNKV